MTPNPQTCTSLEKTIPEMLLFFLKNNVNPKIQSIHENLKSQVVTRLNTENRKLFHKIIYLGCAQYIDEGVLYGGGEGENCFSV